MHRRRLALRFRDNSEKDFLATHGHELTDLRRNLTFEQVPSKKHEALTLGIGISLENINYPWPGVLRLPVLPGRSPLAWDASFLAWVALLYVLTDLKHETSK